jgi:hypothetical protein
MTTKAAKPLGESGILLASSLTLVFVVLVILPACVLLNRRRGHHRRLQLLGLENLQSSSNANDGNKLQYWQRRYSTAEGWLVSKLVHGHDDICEALTTTTFASTLTTRTAGSSATAVLNVEGSDADECDADGTGTSRSGHRECPICFEAFRIGEVVSWSANPTCDHVFHHICIKEWLVERKECPFCRQVFLPVDNFGGDVLASHIPELILGQKRRSAPCFYCLEHHIVPLPPVAQLDKMSISPQVRKRLAERSFEAPDRLALAAIRHRECAVEAGNYNSDHDAPASAAVSRFGALGETQDQSNSSVDRLDVTSVSELCHAMEQLVEIEARSSSPPPTAPSAAAMILMPRRSVHLLPSDHDVVLSAPSSDSDVEGPLVADCDDDRPCRN